MGCQGSKEATEAATAANAKGSSSKSQSQRPQQQGRQQQNKQSKSQSAEYWINAKVKAENPERVYHLLAHAGVAGTSTGSGSSSSSNKSTATSTASLDQFLRLVLDHLQLQPTAAEWQNPTTRSTPLHMACRLVDVVVVVVKKENGRIADSLTSSSSASIDLLGRVIHTLVVAYPMALHQQDTSENIPLHYAVAPTTHSSVSSTSGQNVWYDWQARRSLVQLLFTLPQPPPNNSPSNGQCQTQIEYLQRNDVVYQSQDATGGCTPLYRVIQTLEDDFHHPGPNDASPSPTLNYVHLIHSAYPHQTGTGNASDGDKPLALLYRRFTRQFDHSEQFFDGDNSRPEVVQHRQNYKAAAGNTWKMIELLLKPIELTHPDDAWGIVHCAVQVETPPDLLRYIVETNAQDLTRVDPQGNLPLHYAAATTNTTTTTTNNTTSTTDENSKSHYPAFYTKYVMDELLYKFPEAASMADAKGRYPFTLAVTCGKKQWIGGGIESLYEAYPEALSQVQLEEVPSLKHVLSIMGDNDDDNNNEDDNDKPENNTNSTSIQERLKGIIKDEPHDAIMLVQQSTATIEEVTTSMWAHEEDAGVQMLGCVAIANMIEKIKKSSPATTDTNGASTSTSVQTSKQAQQKNEEDIMRIALSATASVVNAMKAHPNELIVQEKACIALQGLSSADGHREVSMVASGAVAAAVGAMQAHVGDAGVQEQACRAISAIVQHGGAERATVVASVSGVTAILNALAAHAHVVGVQIAGLTALDAMTRFPQANLPELPHAQTEPLLVASRENFPEACESLVAELLRRMAATATTTASPSMHEV